MDFADCINYWKWEIFLRPPKAAPLPLLPQARKQLVAGPHTVLRGEDSFLPELQTLED